ncbi:MAG: NUDIX hydrolase [bacterium]
MKGTVECPECGAEVPQRRNPFPTVDCLIRRKTGEGAPGVVLIRRKNPPEGWAIPGGFVDYGESVEDAVRREMKEETDLELEELEQFHVYSAPDRDPRFHTICTVFLARGVGELQAGDDAADARVFPLDGLPPAAELAFDHHAILTDYLEWRAGAEVAPLE